MDEGEVKATPGGILHLHEEEAQRLTGSLMNDFSREVQQVTSFYLIRPHPVTSTSKL